METGLNTVAMITEMIAANVLSVQLLTVAHCTALNRGCKASNVCHQIPATFARNDVTVTNILNYVNVKINIKHCIVQRTVKFESR